MDGANLQGLDYPASEAAARLNTLASSRDNLLRLLGGLEYTRLVATGDDDVDGPEARLCRLIAAVDAESEALLATWDAAADVAEAEAEAEDDIAEEADEELVEELDAIVDAVADAVEAAEDEPGEEPEEVPAADETDAVASEDDAQGEPNPSYVGVSEAPVTPEPQPAPQSAPEPQSAPAPQPAPEPQPTPAPQPAPQPAPVAPAHQFCPNCGHELTPGAKFCVWCGRRL